MKKRSTFPVLFVFMASLLFIPAEISAQTRTKSDDSSLLKTTTALALFSTFLLLYAYRSSAKNAASLKEENKRLKSYRGKTEEAGKAKDDYLAHISHELRTPLNAVLGMSTLTLQTDLDRKQYEYITKIHSSANMMLGLVNQVLDFSKIEAGLMPLENVEFNLNSIFENLSDVVYVKADEKGLDVIFDVDHDVPVKLVGDPLRINQILINLVTNALKFTEEGEVSVLAKQIPSTQGKVLLEFVVKDTGIGIKKEHIPKLFRSYSQAQESTSRLYGGTGLGLVISKKLIKQMVGDIRVESEYGKGSSFIFQIELDLPPKVESRKYRLPSKESMDKNMLIIDPSATSSSALYRKLEYFHFDIAACSSWQEAQKALDDAEGTFDTIFINAKIFAADDAQQIIDRLAKEPSKIVFIAYNLSTLGSTQISGIKSPLFLERPYSHQRLFDLLVEIESGQNVKDASLGEYKKSLQQISSGKIILAEDNKINQSVILGLLEGTKIGVTVANNGLDVLKILAYSDDYDLILMDINMPVMGGYEAAKNIRQKREYDHIPIIALTASTLEDDVKKSKESGMDGHITKPIIIKEFCAALRQFIAPSPADTMDADAAAVSLSTGTDTLDAADAIERIGGDAAFFTSILSDFKEEYAASADTFKEMLDTGSLHEAKDFAHTLKGVASNISAMNLYKALNALEAAIEENREDDADILLGAYEKALKELLQEIDTLMK